MSTTKNWISIVMGALALSGCGQQAFVATSSVEAQKGPGTFTIPAKVDFLLVTDDTGSMSEAYPQLKNSIPGFLNGLENSGWDYHFANIPLTRDRALDQVVGSRYDSNWGSSWIPPFPGASPDMPGMLTPAYFRTPSNYGGFLTNGDINNASSGSELGLDNITYALYNRTIGTGFIRDDAMLVVLVVGNGEDTSRVNYCDRGDSVMVPCEQVSGTVACTSQSQWGAPGATCRSADLSFNYYKDWLKNVKPVSSMMRFYAAVSNRKTFPNTCLGGYAYQGTRYQKMAAALGGQSFDICSGGSNVISSTLSSLSGSLQNIQVGLRKRFIPIEREPNESTIVVTKSTGEVIPKSTTNGWSYAGYVTDQYMIDYPIEMNRFSGYAIELHGSAKLIGNQSATVSYRDKNLQDSH